MELEGKTSAFDYATYLQDGVAFIGDLAERIQVVEADGRPPLVQVNDHRLIIPYQGSGDTSMVDVHPPPPGVYYAFMSRLAYGVCVGSWDKFNRNVVPRAVDRELMGVSGMDSIAVAYNKILRSCHRLSFEMDGLILQHDDLEILDPPKAEAAILEAFDDEDVVLVGVAGGDARTGLAWWNIDPIGHQLTDSMNIDFGRRTGDVALLEGSLLAFSPWAIRHLRFDEEYPGFHGYDEIAMQAQAKGKRVVVVDVDTHHHSMVGFDSLDSHAEWHRADERFRKKWGL